MIKWTFEQKVLELMYTWHIARSADNVKINFFIRLENEQGLFGMGEVAPNFRHGDTLENLNSELKSFCENENHALIKNIDDLRQATLGLRNSIKMGLEMAYSELHFKQNKTNIFSYFGLALPKSRSISYTIPIMPIDKIASFYSQYNIRRFKLLKLKVNEENAYDSFKELRKISAKPIIIDANESWKDYDGLVKFLNYIKDESVLLVEQPFPEIDIDKYVDLKKVSPVKIFADESITDNFDEELISKQFHGINIKLMKTGGMETAKKLLLTARQHKISTMIGCMVETTLSSYYGYSLSFWAEYLDIDSFLMIKDEPFKKVKEEIGYIGLPMVG